MLPIFFDKHPKIHGMFLIFIFVGVLISWLAFILPFYVYDHFVGDFKPYFKKIVNLFKINK